MLMLMASSTVRYPQVYQALLSAPDRCAGRRVDPCGSERRADCHVMPAARHRRSGERDVATRRPATGDADRCVAAARHGAGYRSGSDMLGSLMQARRVI
jgi:hypothetical protein